MPHRAIRVAIGAERGIAGLTMDSRWNLTDLNGHVVVRPANAAGWGIERRGALAVRAVRSDGYESPWIEEAFAWCWRIAAHASGTTKASATITAI
ncbi:MAG: hypothetical protein U0163_11595 [Gemmatimonadaceae bacterium]